MPGEVRITYSVSENPDRWGFDILGLGDDGARAAAFLVFEASVSYEREGYASIFGWIQVVHYWGANTEAPDWSLLAAPPQLRGLGAPFLTWGLEHSLFRRAPRYAGRDLTSAGGDLPDSDGGGH